MQPLDSSFPLGEGDWTNVIIPGDMNNPGFTHLRSYLISGLLPESEYECLVQARNRFGWSDASRLFTFFTSTKGNLAAGKYFSKIKIFQKLLPIWSGGQPSLRHHCQQSLSLSQVFPSPSHCCLS